RCRRAHQDDSGRGLHLCPSAGEGWGKGEEHAMKSLFLKLFLSFWVAQALFLVLAILVTLALRPQKNSTWEALRTSVLNEAVTEYERGGEQQVRQYLETVQATQHVRAYIFDERGNEISHRAPPDWADR